MWKRPQDHSGPGPFLNEPRSGRVRPQVGQVQSSQVQEEQESERCSQLQVLWLQVGQAQSVHSYGAGVQWCSTELGIALVVVAVVTRGGRGRRGCSRRVVVDDGRRPQPRPVRVVVGLSEGGAQWWQS